MVAGVPEYYVGAEIGVGGVGGKDVWLVAVLICYQTICIREEWHDATSYHLQYCVMLVL